MTLVLPLIMFVGGGAAGAAPDSDGEVVMRVLPLRVTLDLKFVCYPWQ